MPTVITLATNIAFAAAVIATLIVLARRRRLALAPVFAALLAALTACGGATTTAVSTENTSSASSGLNRADPAAVNAAWVAAVRDNDREAAAALYDAGSAEANSYNINHYLTAMADNIHPVGQPRFNYGAFQTVETLNVQDVGAGKRAFSRWVFANKALCYVADLSLADGAWTVTSWGFTTATENCGDN